MCATATNITTPPPDDPDELSAIALVGDSEGAPDVTGTCGADVEALGGVVGGGVGGSVGPALG
eukprot:m.27695 g.27695  ORF g.27695 m.27695 type:complete len:63 (-) comp6457_c0_seq1:1232-1420(-)